MTKIHAYLLLLFFICYSVGRPLLDRSAADARDARPLLDVLAAGWVFWVIIVFAIFFIEMYFRLTATKPEELQVKGEER
jgi:hypothetical protein